MLSKEALADARRAARTIDLKGMVIMIGSAFLTGESFLCKKD